MQAALKRITEEFKLKDLPWIETMAVTSSQPIELEDVHDDLNRELAFYQQALEAAKIGREKVKAAGIPFSRPDDFFAEMVKSDEHMEKVQQNVLLRNGTVSVLCFLNSYSYLFYRSDNACLMKQLLLRLQRMQSVSVSSRSLERRCKLKRFKNVKRRRLKRWTRSKCSREVS
jgi:hypothetical protein